MTPMVLATEVEVRQRVSEVELYNQRTEAELVVQRTEAVPGRRQSHRCKQVNG